MQIGERIAAYRKRRGMSQTLSQAWSECPAHGYRRWNAVSTPSTDYPRLLTWPRFFALTQPTWSAANGDSRQTAARMFKRLMQSEGNSPTIHTC